MDSGTELAVSLSSTEQGVLEIYLTAEAQQRH